MSRPADQHGLVEIGDVPHDPVLHNPDLEPTSRDERTWSKWNLAALWVGMSVCVPTYMLAGNLVASGMNWWEAMLAILLGNLLVLIPMVLNGHAGTKYGIPFPVFARSSFGVFGTHIPSIARALVACGWFGIQTYIGGEALSAVVGILWEGWAPLGEGASFLGMSLTSWISFIAFWLLQVFFVWKGTESIKWLENLAAPFLLLIGAGLLWWAIDQADGLGVLLEQSSKLVAEENSHTGLSWVVLIFLPGLTAMVGYWATLSLNIPDFTRYCSSQREQMLGQLFGLPTTMVFFSFIGVAVTSATVVVYGEAIWDPVELVRRLAADSGSAMLAVLAMAALAVATLSTNIAANVVAPANSFSNAFPRWLSFRGGGMVAAALGVVICPWLVLDELIGFLVSYSGLLGAVGGVLIADYWLLRHTRLDVRSLYDSQGAYRYRSGFNWKGIAAMLAGIAIVLLGKTHPALDFLFQGAWFAGFTASLLTYVLLMRRHIDG